MRNFGSPKIIAFILIPPNARSIVKKAIEGNCVRAAIRQLFVGKSGLATQNRPNVFFNREVSSAGVLALRCCCSIKRVVWSILQSKIEPAEHVALVIGSRFRYRMSEVAVR